MGNKTQITNSIYRDNLIICCILEVS